MKYLFVTICLCITLGAAGFAKKTCYCYSGWACNGNAAGGSYCTNTGYSWYQDASLPCSNANAYDGAIAWASWDCYSPGPGQPYSSVELVSTGSGGTGSDIACH